VTESGIYAIRHIESGKLYVGQAVHIANRWYQHRRKLNRGVHHSRHLQNAWDKFGADAFAFEVLQAVDDPADLNRIEQEHLDRAESYCRTKGYNICREAGSCRGVEKSAEHRAKISAANKGRQCFWLGKKRGPLDQATKAKMAEARRAKWADPEYRARMSEAGKKLMADPEHRAKILAGQRCSDRAKEATAKRAAKKACDKADAVLLRNAIAVRLRSRGLKFDQIGAILGMTASYANRICRTAGAETEMANNLCDQIFFAGKTGENGADCGSWSECEIGAAPV